MDVKPDRGIPASVVAAWGLRERPRKGPKPGLTLDRIVEAAVRVALAEGLAAVSMGRVAGELGTSAMSLYRYVAAKDELVVLMVDAALGVPPPPPSGRPGWRDGLSRWAWGYLTTLRRHPWVLAVPIGPPPVTPNITAWLEDGLASLGSTPLGEAEKLSVMLLVSGYVRNSATVAATIEAAATVAGKTGQVMPSWGAALLQLTDAERFPALRAALGSSAFSQDDGPDDEFIFGLERVLDGIEVLISSRS